MTVPSRHRDYEQLEQELNGSAYQGLLQKLQQKHLFLGCFRNWKQVIAFMRNGTSSDPRKDEILRPIFEAHSEDVDPRWRTILLVIFWPGLESIHCQKRSWDPEPDERWQNIIWTFLQVICRVDVERRPDRLVQKVFNDTVHRLCDEYRRAWNRAKHEIATDPEEIAAVAGVVEGIDFAGIEQREAQQIEIKRLREHAEAGYISEADLLLLVGTRVYGQPIADYASGAGLGYHAAKKRRQRAEAVIRRFEEEKR